MDSVELRPMSVGDIFDTTFRLYRSHFVSFITVVLAVHVPYALLIALLPMAIAGDSAAVVTFTAVGGLILFAVIVWPLTQGALIHNISAAYLGEAIGAAESYRRAAPKLVRLLLANLVAMLIIALGLILLIVPGVIFSLWFMLVPAVVMLESHGVQRSLGRSRELMKGNLGKGFLVALVIWLLGFFFGLIVALLVNVVPWPSEFLGTFVANLIQVLIVPIQLAPITLLYYDLRIRKEGFDLERLAAALQGEDEGAEAVVQP